jgi:hypothetical protein
MIVFLYKYCDLCIYKDKKKMKFFREGKKETKKNLEVINWVINFLFIND